VISSASSTIFFRTFYDFFVVHHASREVLHVQVTQHPTSEWVVQQIVEACGWNYGPPADATVKNQKFCFCRSHSKDSEVGLTLRAALQSVEHFLVFEDEKCEDFVIGDLEGLLVQLVAVCSPSVEPRVSPDKHPSAMSIAPMKNIEGV